MASPSASRREFDSPHFRLWFRFYSWDPRERVLPKVSLVMLREADKGGAGGRPRYKGAGRVEGRVS